MEKIDEILKVFDNAINSHISNLDDLMKRLEKPSTLKQLEMAKRVLIKNKARLHPNPLYTIQEETDIVNDVHKRYEDVLKYIDVLIDTFGESLKVPDESVDIPKELDTPEARKIFDKAIQAGFIENSKTGYKWKGKGEGNGNQLALFAGLVSDTLGLTTTQWRGEKRIKVRSWEPFKQLFGKNDYANRWRNINTYSIKVKDADKIKKIFS